MPTMLDFSITQVYRLVANDLLMMYDTLILYRKYKKTGRSIKEYSEVLANLMEVESENFEEIKQRSKLSNTENANLYVIVWDFIHEIIIKHFIDDLSQYPFWMAKVAITTGPQAFGYSAVESCIEYLKNTFTNKGVIGLYEGVVPYLVASVILNYKYVIKSTNEFIVAVLAKIPNSPSWEQKNSTSSANVSSATLSPAPTFNQQLGDQKILRQANAVATKSRKNRKSVTKESMSMNMATNAVASVLSHPFLVISLSMIKNPGSNWITTYFSILGKQGLAGLYRGVRTRSLLSLVPLSPIFLVGLTDTIMYRRMLGQGSTTDGGGLVSVLRQIVSKEGGGTLSLLNYGLLTLVQLVPGFVSFLSMRTLSWIMFGRSLQRLNQMSRRKEIVESHLITMSKKSINNNNHNNNSGGNISSPNHSPTSTVQPAQITPSLKTAHFNL